MNHSRRSVATVLFTDIVGSTEIAQRLGDHRWREVLSRHHAAIRGALRRYEGKEISTSGDSFLAVFESPALALLCANAIQDAVEDLGLEIRIGLHHGEIVRDTDAVGGIAIHIGARVAAMAGPGEILASGTVRDAVQGAGFIFEDQGEKELRGVEGAWHIYTLSGTPADLEEELLRTRRLPRIRRIVVTVTILGAVLLGAFFLHSSGDGNKPQIAPKMITAVDSLSRHIERSIAVLPFETRSTNEEDVYFARGMHDDLLTLLSQIDSLKVISRTSVERFAGTTTPIREIADELGVSTILEGAIQRSGDRIRLTAQLIDARKDEHIWAATYDEKLTGQNLFAIQTDLARRIAGILRARLESGGENKWGARPTENIDAYLHWARGVTLGDHDWSRAAQDSAATEFRAAIAADSAYALAWAELAGNELRSWELGYRPAEVALRNAGVSIDRALALDPRLALAHILRALIQLNNGKFQEAETTLLRATELAPGLATTHQWYGRLLLNLERYEQAEVEARRALELDPLNPELIQDLGWIRWSQRDWNGAERLARRALAIDPDQGEAWNLLGNALGMKGDHAAAIAAIESGKRRSPTGNLWTVLLANAHAKAGHRTQALQLINTLPSEVSGIQRLWIAAVYGTLGEPDQAYEILDILVREDPALVMFLGYDRDFDPIHEDPRFEDVRRRAREEVERRNRDR